MPTAPDSTEPLRPPKRGGRMSELAAVEETPVWLEVNGRPAVTWMCTPELLEELAVWAVEHCPVSDAVRRAIPVHVEVSGP